RHYPYSERAEVVLEALQKATDLAMIYWSKSERRFQRRIITPLELDGYMLKAFDHTRNDVHEFKITRIKAVVPVARGCQSMPQIGSISAGRWLWVGLVGVALTVLTVELLRHHGSDSVKPETVLGAVPAPI